MYVRIKAKPVIPNAFLEGCSTVTINTPVFCTIFFIAPSPLPSQKGGLSNIDIFIYIYLYALLLRGYQYFFHQLNVQILFYLVECVKYM